jgi:hypothetical protein
MLYDPSRPDDVSRCFGCKKPSLIEFQPLPLANANEVIYADSLLRDDPQHNNVRRLDVTDLDKALDFDDQQAIRSCARVGFTIKRGKPKQIRGEDIVQKGFLRHLIKFKSIYYDNPCANITGAAGAVKIQG